MQRASASVQLWGVVLPTLRLSAPAGGLVEVVGQVAGLLIAIRLEYVHLGHGAAPTPLISLIFNPQLVRVSSSQRFDCVSLLLSCWYITTSAFQAAV